MEPFAGCCGWFSSAQTGEATAMIIMVAIMKRVMQRLLQWERSWKKIRVVRLPVFRSAGSPQGPCPQEACPREAYHREQFRPAACRLSASLQGLCRPGAFLQEAYRLARCHREECRPWECYRVL